MSWAGRSSSTQGILGVSSISPCGQCPIVTITNATHKNKLSDAFFDPVSTFRFLLQKDGGGAGRPGLGYHASETRSRHRHEATRFQPLKPHDAFPSATIHCCYVAKSYRCYGKQHFSLGNYWHPGLRLVGPFRPRVGSLKSRKTTASWSSTLRNSRDQCL